MTSSPRVAVKFDWKQFLNLGEELLKQPNAAAQCALIEQYVLNHIECRAKVWLQEPWYPLPGEPPVALLSDPTVPSVVQLALEDCKSCSQSGIDPANRDILLLAVPLTTQDTLLGGLQVERSADQPFLPGELAFLEELAAFAALALQTSRQVVIKNWRYEQLLLVRSVSAQIANILDPDELCQQVTLLIHQTFGYYSTAIFSFDETKGVLRLRANAVRSEKALPPGFTIPLGQGIIGWVGQTLTELMVPDVQAEPHYYYWVTLPETASEYALPLKVENRLLGVLDVESNQRDAFHETDRLVLHALADNIALALEGSHLYQRLQRRAEQISAVHDISHALSSILDTNLLLEEMTEVIHNRFGFPYVHVFTFHPGRNKIIYRSGSGAHRQAMISAAPAYDLDSPIGLLPNAARSRKTILANDVLVEPLYRPSPITPDVTRSELVIPLLFGDELLGLLDIQSDQVDVFDPKELSIFESLAANIAIAMRNANLYYSEQWRHRVADSFQEVAGMLTSPAILEKLFDTILAKLEENLPCEASAIWLLDTAEPYLQIDDVSPATRRELQLMAARGVDQKKLNAQFQQSPSVRAWLEYALEAPQPRIHKAGDPSGPLEEALALQLDYSSIATPLRAGSVSLGVLTLVHHSPGKYGSEASAMTATFANYAAAAIQNARNFSDAQEQAWVSTLLLQAAETTRSVNSVDDLFSALTRLTPLLPGIRKCGFFIRLDEEPYFDLRAWYGFEHPPTRRILSASETPALAQLFSSPKTLIIQDPVSELNLSTTFLTTAHEKIMLLPLLAHDRLLGAYLISYKNTDDGSLSFSFERRALSVLQGIAHQAATALENILLTEARQEEAYVTAVLLQTAQAVASQNELNDILDSIVHLLPILVGIDTCVIYLWDESHRTFNPIRSYTRTHKVETTLLMRSFARGEFRLLDQVFENGLLHICVPPNTTTMPAGWAEMSCIPFTDQPDRLPTTLNGWLLGFPISVLNKIHGVLLTHETNVSTSILRKRIEMITGVAQQVAIAIQNDNAKQQMVERERIEREIHLARQIQRAFLPEQLPEIPGWEIAARWQTARQVGGDFYDIFKLEDGRIGLVISDVSDKGMPAALYMTVTRTLIRAYLNQAASPAGVLKRVNRLLYQDNQNSMFVTTVLAFLDTSTGQMIYTNAGHNRPLLLRCHFDQVEMLPKGCIALGVLDEIEPVDYQINLSPRDYVLFYTDGVTDSFSPSGESFGEKRLIQTLSDSCGAQTAGLLDIIDRSLTEFRQNTPPADDITLLALRYLNL